MFKEKLKEIPLKDVMAAPAITIRDNEEFHVVQDKLATYDIRHLPVVNDRGTLAGLITQRALYKIHSPRRLEDGSWYYDKDLLDGFILKNVMIQDPVALKGDSTLQEAMDIMIRSKIGSIPIVDELRRPIGIITRGDILKFFLTK